MVYQFSDGVWVCSNPECDTKEEIPGYEDEGLTRSGPKCSKCGKLMHFQPFVHRGPFDNKGNIKY